MTDSEIPVPLSSSTLGDLPEAVSRPGYDRDSLAAGIVHMSVGQFHRSHQAVYLDALLESQPGDWMITGVGALPSDADKVAALEKQDCLYTVIDRNTERDQAQIVGSMKSILHAPSDPSAVIAQLTDPQTKIFSLTVTEKGYCYDSNTNLDESNAAIVWDRENPDNPKSVFGYMYAALRKRKEAGVAPFTVMSCDNLPGNGNLTRKLLLQFSAGTQDDISEWIESEVAFPNSMVDRITPETTEPILELAKTKFGIDDAYPVVCEDYIQWVLEDNFCDGRPELEKVGVQIVPDVIPYEEMKVRLLNGSHSALSYVSYLMGYREVDVAMADPLIAKFTRMYMDHDVMPAVPEVPGVDLEQYKDSLIKRFANPAISDQVQRLALDGSQKIPNAILPCIEKNIETGQSFEFAALALAGWFRYLTGTDESGEAIEVVDPLAEKLMAAMSDPSSSANALAIEEIFGELGRNQALIAAVDLALSDLNGLGTKATLEKYCDS